MQFKFSWNEIYEFIELSSYVVNTFRDQKLIFVQKWICENLTNDNLNIYYKFKLLEFLPKLISNQIYDEPIDYNIRYIIIVDIYLYNLYKL